MLTLLWFAFVVGAVVVLAYTNASGIAWTLAFAALLALSWSAPLLPVWIDVLLSTAFVLVAVVLNVTALRRSIVSDRVTVEQIFQNLMENAVKYSKPGRPGRIEISGQSVGSAAEMVVTVRPFPLAGQPARAADHQGLRPHTAPQRRRTAAPQPVLGRPKAARSGGVLLAPLPVRGKPARAACREMAVNRSHDTIFRLDPHRAGCL